MGEGMLMVKSTYKTSSSIGENRVAPQINSTAAGYRPFKREALGGSKNMERFFYRGYVITPDLIRDESTGRFQPRVNVEWAAANGKRETHSFVVSKPCITSDDAISVAFKNARIWADHRFIR
jgi:hypothetical protein